MVIWVQGVNGSYHPPFPSLSLCLSLQWFGLCGLAGLTSTKTFDQNPLSIFWNNYYFLNSQVKNFTNVRCPAVPPPPPAASALQPPGLRQKSWKSQYLAISPLWRALKQSQRSNIGVSSSSYNYYDKWTTMGMIKIQLLLQLGSVAVRVWLPRISESWLIFFCRLLDRQAGRERN